MKTQTYKNTEILIVDNNSNDGTKEYLQDFGGVKTIFLDDNVGPAGGFHEGIKYFTERSSVDFVWLMDDDFFPFETCLEVLLNSVKPDEIVFPYVREKDMALRLEPGWWGVLIPIEIIHKVGYPEKDYFFWFEDTEYLQHRIRDVFGFKNKWISNAKGVHFTKRVKNFRSPWRYYYEIRNTIYARLYVRKKNPKRIFKLIKSWSKLFAAILFFENNKLEKMKWFLRGTSDGVRGKLGKVSIPS